MMRLAADNTVFRLGGELIVLRPTLRAAMRLERQFGGFGNLFSQVVQGSLSATCAILEENGHPLMEREVWAAGLDNLKPDLMAYLLALTGADNTEDASDGERMPFADYHARLYRIATGWLGWTPETAWTATPAEIEQAYQGRLEMLRAIFGGEEPKPPTDGMPLHDKLRLAFRTFGTRKVARHAE